ncbi:hypothetical protein DAEQUDRAFT_741819 [Daedalea quercina L-15889]|uniref:Uncharacterized protein n=1 Tax=Daedalea quercina L-15889 TaxID=1314783 RepID=A0A165KUH8_9APHY|nr:hypothetical protein DAEQUDRAFT_741819 [Daedalea quercina L-15889]
MCAGDRDSYPPFAEVPLHIPLYADIGLAKHPAPIGDADLAITRNRVTSRLRRISNHSIWEVQGSATAAVLAENRLSAISPVSRAPLSPSPTMLFWAEQTAGNECRDETAPVTTAASRRASNNPFRGPNRPKSSANLEYQSVPMLALPDPVLLATRQASKNLFRQPNRPWAVDIPSSLQPGNGDQPITTPPYEYREFLHPVAHEGHPSGSSNPEAMSKWQPSQLSGFEIARLQEPPTSMAAAWSTESPTLANLNRTWPTAMPQAPGSHHGPIEQPDFPSRESAPSPGPGAVFFTAI